MDRRAKQLDIYNKLLTIKPWFERNKFKNDNISIEKGETNVKSYKTYNETVLTHIGGGLWIDLEFVTDGGDPKNKDNIIVLNYK
jgi:hypothetical protein